MSKELFKNVLDMLSPEDQELLIAHTPSKKSFKDAMEITASHRNALTDTNQWFIKTKAY